MHALAQQIGTDIPPPPMVLQEDVVAQRDPLTRLLNERPAAIIRFITELAHDLGMRTVVEGIEHIRQLVAVAACGCDYGQGYFYYRPICGDRIAGLRSDT